MSNHPIMIHGAPILLHVDDDDDDAAAFADAFAAGSMPVALHRVANGREATEWLQTTSAAGGSRRLPRLILLDLNMPVMSGHQFLQWRGQQTFKRVPVLVLTTSSSAADVALAYQAGANGYLVKPSRKGEIEALVADLATFWLKWIRCT